MSVYCRFSSNKHKEKQKVAHFCPDFFDFPRLKREEAEWFVGNSVSTFSAVMMEIRSHKGQPMLPYNGGKMALEEKPPDILENPEKRTSLDERDAFVRVYIRFVFFVH